MIILDSSGNQDELVPLKKDITTPPAAIAIAPPPYAPAAFPNHIPSYQAIPHSRHRHLTSLRQQSPIRRLLAALLVACLVILLWGVFMDSVNMIARRPPHRRPPPRGHSFACIQDTVHIRPHHPNRVCKDCPPPPPPPPPCHGIDDPIRILPIQYPPIRP